MPKVIWSTLFITLSLGWEEISGRKIFFGSRIFSIHVRVRDSFPKYFLFFIFTDNECWFETCHWHIKNIFFFFNNKQSLNVILNILFTNFYCVLYCIPYRSPYMLNVRHNFPITLYNSDISVLKTKFKNL